MLLHELELGDGLAKLLPLPGVGQGEVQSALHEPHRPRRQGDAPRVQGGEGDPKPLPSFPRTRSLGTRTPSRKTIPVSAALRPSFPFRGLVFTPSPRSTRKQVIPLAPFSGSVLAKTRKTSATLAWEMKVFCPSRT